MTLVFNPAAREELSLHSHPWKLLVLPTGTCAVRAGCCSAGCLPCSWGLHSSRTSNGSSASHGHNPFPRGIKQLPLVAEQKGNTISMWGSHVPVVLDLTEVIRLLIPTRKGRGCHHATGVQPARPVNSELLQLVGDCVIPNSS